MIPVIIPTILTRTAEDAKKRLDLALSFFDFVQIDIMDGVFVPVATPGDPKIYSLQSRGKYAEVHLMVDHSDVIAKDWIVQPFVARILPHVEKFNINSFDQIRELCNNNKKELGLALNPETPLSSIIPLLDKLDAVLLMTVKPGYDGSPFVPEVLNKIRELHALRPNLPIEVDGGVNVQTIPTLIRAGVSRLAVGSALFKAPDIFLASKELKEIIQRVYNAQ